ncbi:hypothetical protein CLOP_g13659 [Closterium sp. NIES-67]|nr:hypothetical protein CLOP_g13659 [Closterium sp. NIES-67]
MGREYGRPSMPWRLSGPWLSGLAAVSYGLASMAMVFLNKGVLTYYKFSITLLALQMIATTALIYLGGKLEWLVMRPFSTATARRLLPLSFFYNANVAFALASLQGVNIPMYIALKRLTPMAVLVTGFFTGKSKPPLQVTLSTSLITFGCLIAALGDFSFDFYAYALALTSVLCQTFYLLLVEKSAQSRACHPLSSCSTMPCSRCPSLVPSYCARTNCRTPSPCSLQSVLRLGRLQWRLSHPSDGDSPQLHHVPLHHGQLRSHHHHSWCAQGRIHHDLWILLPWRSEIPVTECNGSGYQLGRRCLVLHCQVPAKAGKGPLVARFSRPLI